MSNIKVSLLWLLSFFLFVKSDNLREYLLAKAGENAFSFSRARQRHPSHQAHLSSWSPEWESHGKEIINFANTEMRTVRKTGWRVVRRMGRGGGSCYFIFMFSSFWPTCQWKINAKTATQDFLETSVGRHFYGCLIRPFLFIYWSFIHLLGMDNNLQIQCGGKPTCTWRGVINKTRYKQDG